MTTIIATQHDDGVVFGADSQVTSGGKIYRDNRMVKITERNNYIIAGSGECSPCDIAQHIWQPPTPTATDRKDIYHFMIAKVVPSLKKCFKENDYKIDSDDNDETRFSFLIAVAGQVFEIADDFSVALDSSGFYGVGSGSPYALGALRAGASMEIALNIAAISDAYTSAPFVWKTQDKK